MSWEQRRQEWKNSPPELQDVDKWFDSLSPDERFEAFFESESFNHVVKEFQSYLYQFFQKGDPFKFQHEPTLSTITVLLGKIALSTPLFRRAMKENQNATKLFLDSDTKVKIIRRMYAMCIYEPKKGGPMPEYIYNLSTPWQWEETLTELGGY